MPISQRAGGTITLQASEIEIGSVEIEGAGTATVTSVDDSATAVTLLAANTARKKVTIFNDSTETLFIRKGSGTPTTTDYSEKILAQETWFDALPVSTVAIQGIWAANGSGAAKITEET